MSAGKHTPVPWATKGDAVLGPCHTLVALCGKNEQALTSVEMRANARLIVRAVNAHADLMEAAEEALEAEQWLPTPTVLALRTAIQKAKGEA